jgi:ubiquinone/menaquinone biosynthesis C-methylase UbiE
MTIKKDKTMINRRSLIAGTAATVAVGSALGAAGTATAAPAAYDIEPRGSTGRLERMPYLDLESVHDYTAGVRSWHSRNASRVANARVKEIFKANGVDPNAEMPVQDVLALIENDPIVAMSGRLWISNQQITWKAIADRFHANADKYLAEMERYDKRGPGTLKLNPDLVIPEFAKYEIHIQPGGYVGDPFAGHIYHLGTNSFYHGAFPGGNDQDQIHAMSANNLPVPEDGKVKRILDLGCGIGQHTVALKERFPDAEVWGLDVAGPMVRYGHMKAVDLGVDVNFVQALAEDTKFPDNHFDIVTSYIIHHELPAEINKAVFREAHRIARPGGYYYPIDFKSGRQAPKPSAYGAYRTWWDHRWNNERWSMEFRSIAFEEEMEKVGFWLNPDAKPAIRGFGIRHGVKKA